MRIKLCGYLACALMLALGLQSCQQDDVPKGVRYPIVFSNADTRAVADADNLKDGFKVYAFVQGNAGSTSFAKDVVYNADNSVWAFESPEYWIPDTDYYFKAFYPSVPSAGTLAVDNSSSDQSYTITNFDITYQEDVMVASATATVPIGASHPDNSSVVGLNFEHLLACLEINLKSSIPDVKVEKVSLMNITDGETCTNGVWSASSNLTASLFYNEETELTDEYQDVTGGGFVVIPQKRDIKLIIKTNQKEYEVDLSIHWIKGNKYTYTAEIKQNDIIFADAPGVDVWDSESATGSVIIK